MLLFLAVICEGEVNPEGEVGGKELILVITGHKRRHSKINTMSFSANRGKEWMGFFQTSIVTTVSL